MKKRELLKKYIDLESHNLLCYSENYGMTKPKAGYEKEWKETNERITGLKEILKDVQEPKTIRVITPVAELGSGSDILVDMNRMIQNADRQRNHS